MAINHQDNFETNPSSAISAGATTSPLNDIPSIDAPFYLAFDAENANGHYEVAYISSKTATNVNHAALTYAHATDEAVRMVVPATEFDEIQTVMTTGWTPSGETWTYASATTFTIAGTDLTSKYTKGAKIKLTNDSTTKYFYVVSSAFATDTTVTVTGEVNLVSGEITNPFYSYADCPQGFKRGQDWYCCCVYGTNTTVNDNVQTKIVLNAKEYDPNNNFDTSLSRYVAPIAGKYRITASAVAYDAEAKLAQVVGYIRKNNTGIIQRGNLPAGGSNTVAISTITMVHETQLAKGDYIEFFTLGDTTDSGSFVVTDTPRMAIQFIGI